MSKVKVGGGRMRSAERRFSYDMYVYWLYCNL